MKGHSDQNQAGFTLIEVMISLFIILVGALGYMGFTQTVLESDTVARQRSTASHLAEELLEEWAATDDLTIFNFAAAPTAGNAITPDPWLEGGVSYSITATANAMTGPGPDDDPADPSTYVVYTNPGGPAPIERIISVNWTTKGKPHSVTLTHATIFQ